MDIDQIHFKRTVYYSPLHFLHSKYIFLSLSLIHQFLLTVHFPDAFSPATGDMAPQKGRVPMFYLVTKLIFIYFFLRWGRVIPLNESRQAPPILFK